MDSPLRPAALELAAGGGWSLWALENPRVSLVRNPFTRCSCNLCSAGQLGRRLDRRVAQRLWRADVEAERAERIAGDM